MSTLAELLGSRTRAAILERLLTRPEEELHVRELGRQIGSQVQKEVEQLVRLGVLRERRSVNRRYVQADKSHPAFRPLLELIRVTSRVPEVLKDALSKDSRVQLALLFGSIAHGTEKNESDIDLLVVGDLTLGDLLNLLSPAQEELGREINPVLISGEEFKERTSRNEHFVSRVLESKPLVLVGSLPAV
jgi:predicted nucleotidyltransferase